MTTTDDDDATPTRRSRAQMREAIVPHSKVYVRGLRVSVRADAFMYVCTMRSRLDSIAAERRSRATSAARRGVSRRATASESSKRARLVTDLSLFQRTDNWSVKAIGRKTTGTGRMRYLKTCPEDLRMVSGKVRRRKRRSLRKRDVVSFSGEE